MSTPKIESSPSHAHPSNVRPLGKMERSIWFCDQCSPTNIALGCELQGAVTDEALRRALRWCQLRHPLLRSVIRPGGKTHFLACYDAASAPVIPLEISRGTLADADAAVVEQMRLPLAGGGGLMVRAKFLRISDQHSYLQIVFSHVIGDGFSAVLLLQDIVNFLGKYAATGAVPDPEPLPFPPPSEEGIPTEHRGFSGFKKLMAVQKEVAANLKRFGAQPSPVRVQSNPPLNERKIKTHSFRLSEAETVALVARSKQEQVTVYALLSASLMDAMHPLLESAKKQNAGTDRVVSFAAPVDMRPFLTSAVKEHFGFYSSAINHLNLLRMENDLPALARELQADLKRSFFQNKVHLHTTPLLASFLSWGWLFPANAKGVARVAKLTEGMFKSCATSMTFLNDSIKLNEGQGITMTQPRGHISPSIMGAAIYCVLLYKNSLSVHLNYNDGQLSDTDAEQLNARFKENLLALGRAGAAS